MFIGRVLGRLQFRWRAGNSDPVRFGQEISYQKEILKTIPLLASENIQQADTTTLAMESVISIMSEQKNTLIIIFILLCLLGLQYFYNKRLRHRLKEANAIGDEIVQQRIKNILKAN